MAHVFPGDGDQPATRRDLAMTREVIEANVRAGFAELRMEMEKRFGAMDRRMSNQSRFLFATMVTLSLALAGLIVRTG